MRASGLAQLSSRTGYHLVLPGREAVAPPARVPLNVTTVNRLLGPRTIGSRRWLLVGVALIGVAIVGALWWLLFHRHPSWSTWLVGVVPFVAALFVAYTYVERMLPSTY